MTPPTLHRLLWGPNSKKDMSLADWHIRAWEVPAVGLPVRAATYLFLAAQRAAVPTDWNPMQGPLTWQLEDKGNLLSGGRRLQFDFEDAESRPLRPILHPQVRRSMIWEVPPHAAYFLPFVAESSKVHSGGYALYCDILLLLTAMDGGEAILDSLTENGVGSVPFEDRWAWRSRVHLPMKAWQEIERGLRWSEQPQQDATRKPKGEALVDLLQRWTPCSLTLDDFICERVDLSLDTTNDVEVVRTVRPPGSPDRDLPPGTTAYGQKAPKKLAPADRPGEGTAAQSRGCCPLSCNGSSVGWTHHGTGCGCFPVIQSLGAQRRAGYRTSPRSVHSSNRSSDGT